MIEFNHFFYIKTINCILLYLKKIKIYKIIIFNSSENRCTQFS